MSFLPKIKADERPRTQQHFKNDCDINHVVNRYFKTGILRTVDGNPKNLPKFGDFSNQLSYADALQVVQNGKNQFLQLDSAVRRRFKNDPNLFLEFMQDPKNLEEAIKLGLAEKVKPTAPTVEIGEDGKPIASTPAN